jgi:hypothetical protein
MPNWNDVFNEIATQVAIGQQAAAVAATTVRVKYLQLLHRHHGRNIIAYYSGWLSKPGLALSEINDEDKAGFMTTIHRLDRSLGLDLILHTPGGGIAATQSLVNYLQKMFGKNIRAVIPHIALSAGTIMACCCKKIIMGKQSSLGPIDPQLRAIPAYGVVREFRRAMREVKRDPSRITLWQQIIGQYRPTFLGQCENAIRWSNDFVTQQLAEGMFSQYRDRQRRARHAARKLSDYASNKSHDRHFDADECRKFGLDVDDLEADPTLQDLVLTVHHCYMHALMNTPAFKMIENQNGIALVKNAPTVSASQQQGGRAEQD